MKIAISDSNKGILSNILNRAGGLILCQKLQDAATQLEQKLESDQIPDACREGVKYSYVESSSSGSFCFTIEREQGGLWALTEVQEGLKS